jgi:hypothetical protein
MAEVETLKLAKDDERRAKEAETHKKDHMFKEL